VNFQSIKKKPAIQRPASGRVYLLPDEAPTGALLWATTRHKARQLRRWRRGIGATFSAKPSVLKVAWALEWLFNADKGFAFPKNIFLARETGLAVNKIQEALAALEAAGGIIRVYVQDGNEDQRRIYPAAAIATSGGTPNGGGGGDPSTRGWHIQGI
jgi:hypothetical protein